LSRKQQRQVSTEIKRARHLALLPQSDRHRSYRDLN
jgi:ribosomal protein S18